MFFDPTYLLCVALPTLILMGATSWYVKAAYNKWSKVRATSGLTGAQAAQQLISRSVYSGIEGALFLFVDQVGFLLILALGWIVLIRRNDLNAGEISASLLLLAAASIFGFFLFLGYRSADALGNALARIARAINRVLRVFLHRDYLSEERAHAFASEVAEGLADLPEHSVRNLLRPLAHALLNKALLIGVLLCAFLSFDVPFSAGTIIAGWAIGYLFLVVSPTPNGIGIVEGLMPLTLTSLRVPYEAAVVVTLAYRAVTFWWLLAVSAWALRRLHFKNV